MSNEKYPQFTRILSDFLYEEEANISRKRIITVGTLLALATLFLANEALAKHGSHSSHSSHASHASHASHSSHVSSTTPSTSHFSTAHASHASHSSAVVSHASHASSTHSSIAGHSNTGISQFLTDNQALPPVNTGVGLVTQPGVSPITIPAQELPPEGIIDIRVPLTPPKSPSMKGNGE